MPRLNEEVTPEVKIDTEVEKETAEWCLRILELYLLQNDMKTIHINRDNDTVRLSIDDRKCNKIYDGEGGYSIEWLE